MLLAADRPEPRPPLTMFARLRDGDQARLKTKAPTVDNSSAMTAGDSAREQARQLSEVSEVLRRKREWASALGKLRGGRSRGGGPRRSVCAPDSERLVPAL